MANKKSEQAAQPSRTRKWFLPTLGVSVEAESREEALKLATEAKKEQEVGDGRL